MIAIRADANKKIASGHIMRCITIAQELIKRNEDVIFITADHEGDELLKNHGFNHIVLDSDYSKMEEELPRLYEIIEKNAIEKILIDSYSITDSYISSLEQKIKVVLIEDELSHAYDAAMVINYNAYADSNEYEMVYEKKEVRKLLGLSYTPLRPQFRELNEKHIKDEDILNILITTGGADIVGAAPRIVKELVYAGLINKRLPAGTIRLHIIQGALADYSEIEAVSEIYDNIVIYNKVENMAELMRKADIAICTCGMIINECAAMRLPAVFFSLAENQIPNALFWKNHQIYAGDASKDVEGTMQKMTESLKMLIHDIGRVDEIRKNLEQFKLGNGAEKIAAEIANL